MSWWRDGVFYQIYPRSFLDTDGDGVGDLEGVRRQLDYLADLGVDALWITPIYPSPLKDFGYDVSDYCAVDERFGSLELFDRLLAEAHERGLRVVLDWVPNHTSSEHPWFVESRSSRTSPRRDFYVWRDPGPGGERPNNWLRSWSDEPAWTLDDATGQYYLHCFLPEQPDLNWANVEVRRAMADTLRFWLDRGVDGFRMDVIHLIGKDPSLPDDPVDLVGIGHVPLNDRPESHEYLREIRAVLDGYPGDRVSVGEVYLLDPEVVAQYYGEDDELHLSFNFASLMTPWRAEAWNDLIERTESSHRRHGAWPTWVMSNHDNMRVASRVGGDPQRTKSSMALLLCLRGTPFIYAGEELGLPDAEIPPERAVDPGRRDGCRAPIPWEIGDRHGWSGEPWLPFVAGADALSVEAEANDVESMLSFTRNLLAIRRARPSLHRGDLVAHHVDGGVLRLVRSWGSERTEVIVNFSREAASIEVAPGRVLISGTGAATLASGRLDLAGGEAAVVALGSND